MVVTNQVTGSASVLINNGRGKFEVMRLRAADGPYGWSSDSLSTTVQSQARSTDITSGDFNADGTVDIAIANTGDHSLSILLGKHSGGYADPVINRLKSAPREILAGNYNRDDKLDIAILDETLGMISVYRGNGDGSFIQGSTIDAGDVPKGLAGGQLNDDNQDGAVDSRDIPDLLVGNELGDLLPLQGVRDGNFRPFTRADRGAVLTVADLDGDGSEEVVFANEKLDQIHIRDNVGTQPVLNRDSGLIAPAATTVVDLNNDRHQDLIVVNRGGNEVLVFLGQGGRQFEAARRFKVGTSPVAIRTAHLNDDRLIDLLVANESSNDVSILMGNNASLLEPGIRASLRSSAGGLMMGSGPTSIEVADANQDGLDDLLVSARASSNVFLFPGVGRGFFARPSVFSVPSAGQLFLAPDRSGFGVINPDHNSFTYFTGFSANAARVYPTGGVRPVAALAGYFNEDSLFDLIVANYGDASLSVIPGGVDVFSIPYMIPFPDGNPSGLALLSDDLVSAEVHRILVQNDGSNPIVSVDVRKPPRGDEPIDEMSLARLDPLLRDADDPPGLDIEDEESAASSASSDESDDASNSLTELGSRVIGAFVDRQLEQYARMIDQLFDAANVPLFADELPADAVKLWNKLIGESNGNTTVAAESYRSEEGSTENDKLERSTPPEQQKSKDDIPVDTELELTETKYAWLWQSTRDFFESGWRLCQMPVKGVPLWQIVMGIGAISAAAKVTLGFRSHRKPKQALIKTSRNAGASVESFSRTPESAKEVDPDGSTSLTPCLRKECLTSKARANGRNTQEARRRPRHHSRVPSKRLRRAAKRSSDSISRTHDQDHLNN
jgi:hypothetical protein